jgi:hypothetical protein
MNALVAYFTSIGLDPPRRPERRNRNAAASSRCMQLPHWIDFLPRTENRSTRRPIGYGMPPGNPYINDKPTGAVVGQHRSVALAPRAQTTRLAQYGI